MTDSYRKDPEAISQLNPRQYAVTQEAATEPAFDNEFWDKKEAGIYVDIVSGEPLFASTKKFDSGCGWPSFTVPLEPSERRREVGPDPRDDPHRGALEPRGQPPGPRLRATGPPEEGGLRYCINSAALRFVPYEDLEAEGYGEYTELFDGASEHEGGGPMSATTEKAILAGGCFWGMQDLIRKRPGIVSTRVGYSGGDVPNATYRNHGTHAEAIEITFDPDEDLVPRDPRVLLPDPRPDHRSTARATTSGTSYRSAIFYLDDEQRRVAEDTIADVEASGLWPGTVVTEVAPAGPFWEAEPEHQDYLEHYPNGYTCHFPRPGWVLPRRSDAVAR